MKKFISIAISMVALLSFVACNKENGGGGTPDPTPDTVDVTGCWELARVETKSATVGSETVDVYIQFQSGSFELYQRIGDSPRYTKFTGTYSLDGTRLGGKYDNGTAWATSYEVSKQGTDLILSCGSEKDVYKKIASLPSNLPMN